VGAMPSAPLRASRILSPDTVVQVDERGRWRAFSPHSLRSYPDALTDQLAHWAEKAPDRTLRGTRLQAVALITKRARRSSEDPLREEI